jgi:HEAT repeat protein
MKAKRLLTAFLLATLVVLSTSGPPPIRRRPLTAKQKLIRLIQILWEPDDLAPIIAAPLLGISRDPLAIEALLRAANDPRGTVRYRAIQGLGYVRDPRATRVLLAAIRDPQTYAAIPLRRLNDPGAVDPLLRLLHDPSPDMRSSIIRALGSSNDPRAHEAILSALEDPSPDVRASAVRSIGAGTYPRALQALASALGRAPEAARALIARSEHEAVDALLSGLRSPDEKISSAVSEAFWQHGNINQINVPIFVKGLCAALEDESFAVAARAAMALGPLGDRRAVGGGTVTTVPGEGDTGDCPSSPQARIFWADKLSSPT